MYILFPFFCAFGILTVEARTLSSPNAKNEDGSVYQSCDQGIPGMLNVHLVCHTHDDVGWLKTEDQYFYGANQSIQRAGVQYILDSVVSSLTADISGKRKFTYVETAFFWRWWNEQHDSIRHRVQDLVRKGKLQFSGGGWSMNDEATTHYNSIIDQMTWGHRLLNDTFGEAGLPKVAWQIDPFGHSREQASLFAQMYFDGLFFGRLDYRDKESRKTTRNMELLWRGSTNLGGSSDLFTGVLPNSYSPPPGFCFDILCDDPPIMDDPKLKDYNVEERVSKFINYTMNQAQSYATNHIILTMGNDFNYQAAEPWFKNLEKLIYHVNKKQGNGSNVNVFFSTPACYLYALNQANKTWTQKFDDFLPYASDPHAYWTGYFTSRPAIKRFERIGNNKLQICKQLGAMANVDQFHISPLRRAMGTMQHHDAVTGTEKQHVAYDYAQTLTQAISQSQTVVNEAYEKLFDQGSAPPIVHIFCTALNISECNITESSQQVAVTIYNPLAWNLTTYIRLPVTGKAYDVVGPDGNSVDSQIIDIPPYVLNLPGRKSKALAELVFKVNLPPLGYTVYFLHALSAKYVTKGQRSIKMKQTGDDLVIQNEFYTVTVDGKTGLLRQLNSTDGSVLKVNQSFFWYQGMNGNNSDFNFRASGAYIFRPNGSVPVQLSGNVTITGFKGLLVQEIWQKFSPWLSQTIRLYKGVENVELDWVVGPIPINDDVGKEIISRFDTDLDTKSTFFTDSNGREMMLRLRDKRITYNITATEPVSENYYPVNSRIYLQDSKKMKQFTVLNDRSQGGSSLKDGSLELMVHRRLLHDDAFGVGEALNESGIDGHGLVIRGRHFLIFSDTKTAASKHRPLAQKLYMQPQITFAAYNESQEDFSKKYRTAFGGLKRPLPDNVFLLTLEPWKGRTKLIRFEHIYEFDEDPELSKPAQVSFTDLFSNFTVVSYNETTLSANQYLSKAKRLNWRTTEMNAYTGKHFNKRRAGNSQPAFSLSPMEIRTFIVHVQS